MRQFQMVAWIAVAFLCGCGSSEQEISAASAEPQALMEALMPGWKAMSPTSLQEIALPVEKGKPPEVDTYTMEPGTVIKLGGESVVLIAVGVPADNTGVSRAGHATSALLSAYWFNKRGDRWIKVAEQIAFTQEGFSGVAGELKQVDLGGGQTALSVENGSCWQGMCGSWLALYAIGEKQVSKVFGGLMSSDSEGATESCSDLMKLPVGHQTRVPLESYSTNLGCYGIDGQWKIAAEQSGPGRLVIDYKGKQSSGEAVPIQGAAADNAESAGDEEDSPTDEYLVTVSEVRQKQIYRFEAGKYVLESGENPNPGL